MDPQAIRELQHMLRTIALTDPRLIPLVVDGVYGPQTTDAVRIFQQFNGLPPTGTIDHRTWDAIRTTFQQVQPVPPRPLEAFPHPDFVLRPGERNELARLVAYLLNRLSFLYPNLPPVQHDDRYAPDAEAVIRDLQASHGLVSDGIIDRVTWDLLADLYNHRQDTVKG